ncbi:hypothetical protein B296_00031469, partial [Ensete ventricosum]
MAHRNHPNPTREIPRVRHPFHLGMLDSMAPPAADPSRIARPPADHMRPTRRPKKLPPGVRSPASIR